MRELANIPWGTYDYIGVAGYVGYADRQRATSEELAEYGCHSARWRIDFPSPFNELLYRSIKKARGSMARQADFNLAMNHYGNVKTAYMSGAKRALFMEDDIAFLKDKHLMAEVMSEVPPDADIELYDWKPKSRGDAVLLHDRGMSGGHWVDAGDVALFFFSMVGLSRRGMAWLIDKIESGAFRDGLHDIDGYFCQGQNDGIKTYIAFPHVAIQVNTGRTVHSRNKAYGYLVNRDDYFVREDMAGQKRPDAHVDKGMASAKSVYATKFSGRETKVV